MIFILACLIPIALALIVGFGITCLWSEFPATRQMIREIHWPRFGLGLIILSGAVFLSYLLGDAVRGGSYSFPIQLNWLFGAAIAGLLVGLTKLLTFSRKGWIVGGLTGFVFPATLFISYWLGVAIAPEAEFRCDIPLYVQEINTWHTLYGKFPDEVESLRVSGYPSRPNPCPHHADAYGLLYEHTSDYYLLGRFSTPSPGSFDYTPLSALLGPRVCIYDSRIAKLSCGFNAWGPLAAPTPKTVDNGLLRKTDKQMRTDHLIRAHLFIRFAKQSVVE